MNWEKIRHYYDIGEAVIGAIKTDLLGGPPTTVHVTIDIEGETVEYIVNLEHVMRMT